MLLQPNQIGVIWVRDSKMVNETGGKKIIWNRPWSSSDVDPTMRDRVAVSKCYNTLLAVQRRGIMEKAALTPGHPNDERRKANAFGHHVLEKQQGAGLERGHVGRFEENLVIGREC